jgi:hypothetical protein
MEEAARTGLPTATDIIPEISELGLEQVVLICQPIFAGLGSAEAAPTLRGFAVAAVPMGEIWQQTAGMLGEADTFIDVSLLQLGQGVEPRVFGLFVSTCR